jgi:hypothetical protein
MIQYYVDEHTCEDSNDIHASATDEFIGFLKEHGIAFQKPREPGGSRRMPTIRRRRPALRRASSAEPRGAVRTGSGKDW